MNIVLIGFTSCGKSTTGRLLAKRLALTFYDLDSIIESRYHTQYGPRLSCRQIFKQHGETFFRQCEADALSTMVDRDRIVLATGGGVPLLKHNRDQLSVIGYVVYLATSASTILTRMGAKGVPAYLGPAPSVDDIATAQASRASAYEQAADVMVDIADRPPSDVVEAVIAVLPSGA